MIKTERYSDSPQETAIPKQSVLVIDDSFDTLILMRTVLELANYEVYTAQSGTEALELLSEIDEPNLVLLDVQMDDMTGLDFLKVLEEKKPEIILDVPVVFLTGMDSIPKSKAIGFIRKPTDMDQFLKTIQHYIEMGRQAPYKH